MFFSIIFADSLKIITHIPYNEQKAELGKMLFFDKTLSQDKSRSCETCHNLYWNANGTNSNLNQDIPTILNSAFNFLFFKDGKIDNIYKQVDVSITNNNELNTTKEFIVDKVFNNPKYKKIFYEIYQGFEYKFILDAFVNFEKTLITPNGKYDKFISGDTEIFNESQKRGYKIFNSIGCISCHNGINFGGNLIVKSSNTLKRVPILRNISKTPPYFYNNKKSYSLKELLDAKNSDFISTLTNEELDDLYNFLLTLDGEMTYIKSNSAK